jgi:hypothetical protein
MQTTKKIKGTKKVQGGVLDTPDSLFKVINHGDNTNPMKRTWKKQNFYEVPIIQALDAELVDLLNYYKRRISRNPDSAGELRALFHNDKNHIITQARDIVNNNTTSEEREFLLGQIDLIVNYYRPAHARILF